MLFRAIFTPPAWGGVEARLLSRVKRPGGDWPFGLGERTLPRQRPCGSAINPAGTDPPEADRPSQLVAQHLGPLGDLLGCHIARASGVTLALFEQHVGQPFSLRKVA